jgi:uncharacterized membrane protein
MSYKVSPKRHLAKTVSYRIISTLIGFFALWWATGDIKFGTAFGFMELIFKPFLYYAHERAWYKWFKFGLIEEKKPKLKKVQLNEVETKVLDQVQSETFSEEPTNLNQPTQKKVLNYSSNR